VARRALIIEFSHAAVRAGVFSCARFSPEAYFSIPLEGKGVKQAVNSVLSAVAEKEKIDPASCDIFVSVAPHSVILRVLDLPVSQRDKINEILPFELAGTLSVDVDEAVVDNIPVSEGRAIAVALEKKTLAEYLDAFSASNADPVWVGVAGFSIPRLLYELEQTAATVAYISEDFMSVSVQGRPIFFNSYSGPGGLRLSLKYLEAEGVKIDAVRYTGLSPEDITAILPGVAAAEVELPEGLDSGAAAVAAVALEVCTEHIGATVNFRKGEFENTRDATAFRKKLRLTLILAAALLVFVAGDFYIRYLTLNSELAAYKLAMKRSYTELFPGEKSPADELYQLSVKLKAVEKESEVVSGGPVALELLKIFSDAASTDPAARVSVREISIAEGKLRANGEAASFEAANKFKEQLSVNARLKNVQLTDLKSKTGGGAAFSLSMSVL